MNCRRCHSHMIEVYQARNRFSQQSWYQCTCCKKTQVITQPRHQQESLTVTTSYPSRFAQDLLPVT